MRVFTISIINCILLYFAYLYLRKLKSCPCVDQDYTDTLRKTELTVLSLVVFSTSIGLLEVFFKPRQLYQKHFNKYVIFVFLFMVCTIIVNTKFVYDTYHFYRTLKPNCKCANKWPKYFIYYDATVFTFSSVFFILAFSIIGYVAIKSLDKLPWAEMSKSYKISHRQSFGY